jgi:hypothetical protein
MKQVKTWTGCVEMGHGAGGRDMADLIETMFVREFANDTLTGEEDQAILNVPAGRLGGLHRWLRRLAALLSGQRYRRIGRERNGQ